MSRLFGPTRQLGYVVRNLDRAIAWWLGTAQVGPWFRLDRSVLPQVLYHGGDHRILEVSAAFANSGDLQIELIQQHCATPSVYRGAASGSARRLHHISSWPAPDAYADIHERARAEGYVTEMEVADAANAFAYFSRPGHDGPLFEMAALTPWRERFFDRVRAAARDWDGHDPIRDPKGRPFCAAPAGRP